jgi:hypothetical protein
LPKRGAGTLQRVRWKPGQTIVRRYVRAGSVLAAQAVRVLEDSIDGLDFCILPGAERAMPRTLAGAQLADIAAAERFVSRWQLVRDTHDVGPIRGFVPADCSHAVLGFYARDGAFLGWYGNLETRTRRWAGGLDVVDLILDLWLPVDGEPEWLDEDEVPAALAAGIVTPAQIAAARAEGERVLERRARAERPFRDGWETWRRDPAWPLPRLPDGWDR